MDAKRAGGFLCQTGQKRLTLGRSPGRESGRSRVAYRPTDLADYIGAAGLFTTAGATANVSPGFNPWSAQVGIRHRF